MVEVEAKINYYGIALDIIQNPYARDLACVAKIYHVKSDPNSTNGDFVTTLVPADPDDIKKFKLVAKDIVEAVQKYVEKELGKTIEPNELMGTIGEHHSELFDYII